MTSHEPRSNRHGYNTLYFEPLVPLLDQLKVQVSEFVTELGYNPEDVWYSGFNPDVSKPDGGEHAYDTERHNFFLGDFRSLTSPEKLADDEELQNEYWVANPLMYALEGGTLAVYDPNLIIGNPQFEGSDLSDDDFGTKMVVAADSNMKAAEIGRMNIL